MEVQFLRRATELFRVHGKVLGPRVGQGNKVSRTRDKKSLWLRQDFLVPVGNKDPSFVDLFVSGHCEVRNKGETFGAALRGSGKSCVAA